MSASYSLSGLDFFGTIMASVAHEMKNHLSVMNEQAGLLEDWVGCVGQGMEIEPEKLTVTAHKIQHRISLTNDVIQTMSRFAHSTDNQATEVILQDLLTLFCAVSQRILDMKKIRIIQTVPPTALMIESCAFVVMDLLWHCVSVMTRSVSGETAITIKLESSEGGAQLSLFSEGCSSFWMHAIVNNATIATIVDFLGVKMAVNKAEETVVLKFPPRQKKSKKEKKKNGDD